MEAPSETNVVVITLPLLVLIRDQQQKHGLRHNDYQRYRGYCSRRLLRIRKALKFIQMEKKKFVRKDVTVDMIVEDTKYLQIPLIAAERAWAYAMQLKFESAGGTGSSCSRKKFHLINRLRKADFHAAQLESLVMTSEWCDARSKLEVQAYRKWIAGTLFFETQDWQKSMSFFTTARTIYEKLSSTLGEQEGAYYKQRMEEIVPNLRYCAYNIGDASAKQDLMNLRGHGGGLDLDDLIKQTLEQQAATLQEVEWRGRKLAVKQEKVRMFLLREHEFKKEVEKATTAVEKIEAYESLMLDCKDAIQILREDLIEDPNFRNRQLVNEGPVTPSHFLYTYLTFIKHSKVIERNLVIIDSMRTILEGKMPQPQDKKPIKHQDLVRLYDNIISNLSEFPNLAGLEEDLAFKQKIESQVLFYKGLRCYFIAQSFLTAKKWPEAMALFQRAVVYANQVRGDSTLSGKMRDEAAELIQAVEGKQFVAHANSILDNERVTEKMEELTLDKNLPLLERLDHYYEDPELTSGSPNFVNFPPNFTPIPCKPLFFDLALEHVLFPSLEEKMASSPAQTKQQGGGGWLGGWLGGLGGKK